MPIVDRDVRTDARPGTRSMARRARDVLSKGGAPNPSTSAALAGMFRLVSGWAAHGLSAVREPQATSTTGVAAVPISMQGLGSTHVDEVASAVDASFREAFPNATVADGADRLKNVLAHAHGNADAAEPSEKDRLAAILFMDRLDTALS